MKKIIFFILLLLIPVATRAQIFRPIQGGTGINSATAGDIGYCLKVLSVTPFAYELGACGGGGGAAGVISTTTPLVNTQVVFSTGVSSIANDSAFTYTASSDRLTVPYASTTVVSVGNIYASTPSQGFAFLGTNGLLSSIASSSVKLSWFNNDAGFITSPASTTLLSDTNYWSGRNTFTNSTTTNFGISNLYANGSGGIDFHSSNGTPIATWGGGAGSNVTFYGGVNIDGTTRLATSLTGIAKLTSGTVSTASNGTDYTLITGTTCSGSDKVSAISASGSVTCSADQTGGGGSGSGTVSTSTPLVSGQVAFSTGVSTIGNDSNFTFDSVSDKLTVSLASTTGLSADFGFFNYINATSTTATSTFAGAVQVGSTAGDHLLKMTASRSHGTGASTGGMVNLNNTLNNSSALTIYSNAGAGQSTLGLQFIKQDNALADTYLQRLDNDGVGRTILINAINPLSTASVFDIQNTSSGVGININQASTTTTLSPITITNAGMTPGIQITQTNASNSQGTIRIDSATPEIEMVETDQVSPAGKFEMRVNNNVWGVNSRVLADNSFEEVMSLSQLSQGGALTLLYPGVGGYPTKNSRFGIIGINTATTTNYLSISTDGSSGSGQGTPLDDIFVIKGSNGNVGIASSSPSSIFSIGTTNGINFTTATTSFSTTGGINIASGCFSIAGTCISGGGGGGVTSVTATYPMISSGGTTPNVTIAFSTTTANIWSALNTFNGGLTIGTTTAGILRTNASGVVYASSASTTISLFNGFTNTDTGGNSWIQPSTVNAPAGTYGGMVYIASSTSAKTGFYGTIDIPDNFASSSAQIKVNWTATSTASGNVVFDFDYRCVGGDNTTSLYSATFQESTTTTVANPTTGGFRKNTTLNINAGYYCSAGDTMEFFLARDGADGADTGNVDTEIYNAVIKFLTQ